MFVVLIGHGVLRGVSPPPNLGGGNSEHPPTKVAKQGIPPPTVSEQTMPWRNICDSTLIIIGPIYESDIMY